MHLPTALPVQTTAQTHFHTTIARPKTVSAIYFDLVIDAGIDHKTIRNRFNAERFQRQYFD
jgi:hypothetical protein